MLKSSIGAIAVFVFLSQPTAAQCVVGTNAALSYDGSNDYCAVPPSNMFDGWGDFTIECWLKTTSTATFQAIATKINATGSNRPLTFALAGGAPHIGLNQFNGGGQYSVFSGVSVNDGLWHHCAAVRSGGVVSIYVDGVSTGIAAPPYATAVNSGSFSTFIGCQVTSSLFAPFNGSIDELRVWNTARTPAEIVASMNIGALGSEPGLFGYWRFDEGSGQAIFNSAVATGAALDGVLGANVLATANDPAWATTNLPPVPYCAPCPSPPCGQVNTPCATLTVNGIGAAAQGPFNVAVPPGGALMLSWSGAANQPFVLVATTNLVPGQGFFTPAFVVDVNLANFVFLLNGLDPYWGPLFFTDASGAAYQTFGVPTTLVGSTLSVQGLVYDLGQTCSAGLGFMTTASFAIQL
jgi:hypothetical protein